MDLRLYQFGYSDGDWDLWPDHEAEFKASRRYWWKMMVSMSFYEQYMDNCCQEGESTLRWIYMENDPSFSSTFIYLIESGHYPWLTSDSRYQGKILAQIEATDPFDQLDRINYVQEELLIRYTKNCQLYTAMYSLRFLPLDLIHYILKF